MLNSGRLAGRTLFITGASRGIGKAIAMKAAKDGANIVIAAKTAEPHPKLKGTIYTAAEEVEKAGGKCLPCVVDVRSESEVENAVESAVKVFGGIDIVINNASAIHLTGTVDTPMKRYDLMHNINCRGTFLVSKVSIPHLKNSKHPHILNISPPLVMESKWFKNHVAYTMAKFGMSMCVLGMADELQPYGIPVNALWPKTAIATAAMEMLGGKESVKNCRKPEIMADAAYALLTEEKPRTGQFLIDENLLREKGVTNFEQYAVDPSAPLSPDFFLTKEDLQSFPVDVRDGYFTPAAQSKNKSAEGSTIENIFGRVKNILDESVIKQSSGMYSFSIQGEGDEVWYLDLSGETVGVGRGEHPSKKPDVTFTLDKESFIRMFSGSLNPTSAFMSGKLKLKGNIGLAMKLEKVMSEMKSKL